MQFLSAHFVSNMALCGLLSVTSLAYASEPSADQPSAIDRLAPGEWYEVPNSRLDAVAAPESKFPWLRGGVGGIIDCWAGGAFDTQRDRLYIGPGGGHGGYNGNEIYAFDLQDLKWRRITDPDPVIRANEYTDPAVAPFAMHTYDGVEYLPPPADRYVVIGGWGTSRTYALDPDHPNHWEVYADHGTGRTGDFCAYDPAGERLWLDTPSTSGKLSEWGPLSHLWTLRLNTSPEPSYYETADVDFTRHLLVSCGKGKLKVFHLEPVPAVLSASEVQTTGDTDVANAPSPGFCYVPLIDRFVAWANGTDVYTLDLDAKRWTKHAAAPTNHVTPGPPAQWGTFGRFRYVPSRNVFVLYNDVKQNVFIYRLTGDRPNVITAVEATPTARSLETDIPIRALTVQAVYADGTRRDVTDQADYFSLDPTIARTELHSRGNFVGVSAGVARLRAVYTDPAFKRGFSTQVSVPVKDIIAQATLDSIACEFPKVTVAVGDAFQLQAIASYTRGESHFTRDCTATAAWDCDGGDRISLSHGLLRGISPATATVHATFAGKSAACQVVVAREPVIRRINFQVKETPVRAGWDPENGRAFTEGRGFGWLDTHEVDMRDDRASAHHLLQMRFNTARQKPFKVKVPPGFYTVRISMGDSDYGAVPFADWTALGTRKLIYYEGQHNNVATNIVEAGADGLVFTVNGPINYLIVAPIGIDLSKYADDGP